MSKNFNEEFQEQTEKLKLFEPIAKRIFDSVFKVSVASNLTDPSLEETDYSTLTVSEVVGKIRDFLAQNPRDANQIVFLQYLATYPVSTCKRDVSPRLRRIIGFHYRLGTPDAEQEKNGAEKVSYDDLSEIFVRSKATISECVNKTEFEWKELQAKIQAETELEAEAKRQLLEEKKRELRENENSEDKTEEGSNK